MPNATQLPESAVARLAHALAVPGSRPRLYKRDGSNRLSAEYSPSFQAAVDSGRPFVIELRDAVVGIDFDPGEVAERNFTDALALLRNENLPHIRVTSGRPGHEHVFIVLPAWQRADRFVERLVATCRLPRTAIRWKGHGTYMRPPLTPHRSGSGSPNLLFPDTIEVALDLSAPRLDLPAPTQHILDAEQYGKPDPNRSRLKARVMTGAVAGDVCFEHLRDLLWNDGGPIGDKVREQGFEDIERSWRTFQDYVSKNPPKRAGHLARALADLDLSIALFAGWRPQTLHNDRAALWALCETARSVGSLRFTAARRTLATRAGLEAKTLADCLSRLESFGFVEVLRDPALLSERGSFCYQLRNPLDHSTPDKGPILSIEPEVSIWRQLDPSHDAFAPKALGKQGWLILVSIPHEGASAETIAKRCGYASSESTVKRLRRLMRLGLVECDETGLWHAAAELNLDAVAHTFRTAGRSERMAQRFEAERLLRVEERRSWATRIRRSA